MGGLGVFALGSLASAFSPGLPWLIGARLVCGAGSGVVSLAITGYVSVAVAYERRGRAMGIVQTGYLVALLAGVPAGALVAERFGVRSLFMGLAVAAGLFLLGLSRLESHPGADRSASHRDLLPLLKQSAARLGLVLALFTALGVTAAITYLGAWLVATFGLRTFEVGKVFLAAGIAPLVAGPLAGYLSDRIGKRRLAAVAGLGLAASFVALPLLESSLPAVMGVFFAAVFCESARRGPLQAFYTGLVPLERVGAFTSLKNASAQVGSAVGTALGAVLLPQANGFVWICAVSALATVISSLLLWAGPEPLR